MKIGIMYSGINHPNGADYVANFMINACKMLGYDTTSIGGFAQEQAQDIPNGLDVVIHSSGAKLTPELVEKFQKKSKVFLWTHNDDLSLWWPELITPLTNIVDKHFSYTLDHDYGEHVEYMPLGADDSIYHKIDIAKIYDVCLVGCAHTWRREFVQHIYKAFPRSRLSFQMNVPDVNINTWYNQSKIVIAPMQDCDQVVIKEDKTVFGCPCRTFDVSASGAFHLQVKRKGLDDIFDGYIPTVHPVSDPKLAATVWMNFINEWLTKDEKRKEISLEMMAQIHNKHLYKHRIKQMLEHL